MSELQTKFNHKEYFEEYIAQSTDHQAGGYLPKNFGRASFQSNIGWKLIISKFNVDLTQVAQTNFYSHREVWLK